MQLLNFCAATKCKVPELGRYISITPIVAVQSVGNNITYQCDDGYEIAGTTRTELISQCLENNTWSENPPQCEGNGNNPYFVFYGM